MALQDYQAVPVDIDKKKYNEKREQFAAHIQHSFSDSDQAREERRRDWEEAWNYYRRQEPVFKGRGFCLDYIEPVLQDAVDSILPSMLNVFAENDSQAVAFRPQSKLAIVDNKPVPMSLIADAVNNEINDIFLRQNNGYNKLYDAMLECLVTGDAYGKVYSEECITEYEAEIDEYVPAVLLESIMQEYPDTDLSQFKTRTKDGVDEFKTDGKAVLKKIESKIKFDYIPFGELFIEDIATDIDTARYLCQRISTTKGQLLSMFPGKEEEVKNANTINALGEAGTSLFKMETLKAPVSKDSYYESHVDEAEVNVYLYEHYIYSSLLDGESKLYQVYTVDGEATEILEVNEVGCHPFIKGEVQPLPDSFWGISLHSVLKEEQKMLTWLTNEIAEDATLKNKGRYLFKEGALKADGMRALLDARPGGAVPVQGSPSDSVMPFPYHPLAASTENLYQKMKESVNASKGNAMSLDMNGALNNAAASTVAMAVQNAEMQDKKFSKAFALSFMKPLFRKMYKIIKAEGIDIEHDGQVFPANSLPGQPDFVVDVNTSADGARIAGQLANIASQEAALAASQSPLIGAQERYEIYSEMLKVTGTCPDKYLVNPADNPPTPEEQAKQAELEHGQAEMMRMDKLLKEIEVRTKTLEALKVENDIQVDAKEVELKAIKTAHEISNDEGKLSLEQAQAEVDAVQKQADIDTSRMIAEADVALTMQTGNPHVNISSGS